MSLWRLLAQFPLYALAGAAALLGQNGAFEPAVAWTAAMICAGLALAAGRAAKSAEDRARERSARSPRGLPLRGGRSSDRAA
ncbi:MAG: hypothetical protein ACKVVT_17045 [Dehalococcoidia bacterium]